MFVCLLKQRFFLFSYFKIGVLNLFGCALKGGLRPSGALDLKRCCMETFGFYSKMTQRAPLVENDVYQKNAVLERIAPPS